MRTVRKLASLAAVGALALTTVSCAESERSGDGEGGEGSGDSTFTFGAAGAPEMFDPLYATDGETFRVTRQMFQGLLGIEPGTAEVVPELATEWTSNEEGTEWTFTLRDDVTFHDGEPFNAEAVCANFERMFDQNEAGQVAAEYWGYVMGSFANDPDNSLYQGCEASDEFEAVVTISRSTSGFPTMLTLASLAMQSPAAMESGDANGIEAQGEGFSFPDYAQNPVGTGPYQFVEYDQAVGTVSLEAFDDYWGDAPASSNLTSASSPTRAPGVRSSRPAASTATTSPTRPTGRASRRAATASRSATRSTSSTSASTPRPTRSSRTSRSARRSTTHSTASSSCRRSCPRGPRSRRSSCRRRSAATTRRSSPTPTTPTRPGSSSRRPAPRA